jgi:NAD/NADP transhydrogenase alpha subunit
MTLSAISGFGSPAALARALPVAVAAPSDPVTVDDVIDAENASAGATKGLYKGSDGSFYIDSASLAAGGNLSADKIALSSKGKSWTSGKAEAIGLRIAGSGYEVMLKTGSGPKASYSVQTFSGAGEAVGKAQKLTTVGMLNTELTFDQDFSGDASKGDVVASVLDATDSGGVATDIGLYKLTSGRFAIDLENKSASVSTSGSVVYLTSKGKSWSPGKAEAIAVRKTVDGFEVLLKTGSGDKTKYSLQAFDSEGALSGKAVKLTNPKLVVNESAFKQDFNADGVQGDYITQVLDAADVNGTSGLYKTKAGYYGVGAANLPVGDQSALTYLESKGKVWTPGKANAVSLRVDDDGLLRVATRAGSGAKAKVAEAVFQANGVAIGKTTAIKSAQLSQNEIAFDDDLNGDAKIGNSAFKIEVDYSGDATYKNYFIEAAQRWSQIIVGELPNVGAIDDLKISATIAADDGPGGRLGFARPLLTRTNADGGLPYTGEMSFDSADMASMVADNSLAGVILHEMGHVLGLGTLWSQKGLLDLNSAFSSGGVTYYSKYIGSNALEEYKKLPGGNASATFIQLENNTVTYGGGSLGSHWKEDVFNSEIMTPSANGSLPISRMTVGSLKDLGYEVVYAAADSYTVGA